MFIFGKEGATKLIVVLIFRHYLSLYSVYESPLIRMVVSANVKAVSVGLSDVDDGNLLLYVVPRFP